MIGTLSLLAEESAPNPSTTDRDLLGPVFMEFVANGASVTYSVKTTSERSILDGPVLVSYKNGQRWVETRFKSGKLNGEWISYHPNGKIEMRMRFKSGFQEGVEQTRSSQGGLRRTTNYVLNEKDGTETYYSNQGQVTLRIKWNKGTPLEIAQFENGKKTKTMSGGDVKKFIKDRASEQMKENR